MSNLYSRKTIDLEAEKNLIIGMIMSTDFLKDISSVLVDLTLIKSPYLRKVASWCLNYYEDHEKAPKNTIQDIFQLKSKELEEQTFESIEKVLIHLNEKYIETDQEFDYEFFYKKSEGYLRARAIEQLTQNLNALVSEGEIEEAETEIANFKRIERIIGTGIDVLHDSDAVTRMFSDKEESLFSIPGAFGEAIKDVYKGDIVAFGGASKRGKSWYMMQFAIYALLSGLKVVWFSLEMKEILMMRRFFQYFMAAPRHEYPDGIEVPEFNKKTGEIEYKYVYRPPMNVRQAKKAQRNMATVSRQGGLKLFDITTGGGSIKQMCATLDREEHYNDFIPDVVVIDYADIIPAESFRGEKRHQDTETWLSMKQNIAQKRDCLVVTGSQLDRKSITNDAGVQNISENIRRFDQVSHWITLNQTPKEKKAKLMRIKVDGRHDEFETIDEVVCLQSLATGRPVVGSAWKRDIPNYTDILDAIV